MTTETLADSRCPLCAWVGTTDADTCPECGHGLLSYKVTLASDTETLGDVDHVGTTPAVRPNMVLSAAVQRSFNRGIETTPQHDQPQSNG